MSKVLLIDSSFILFKTVPNKVQTPEEKKQGIELIKKSYLEICNLIDWYIIEKIMKPTKCEDFIGYLDGKGNFRKEIAPNTYKVGRSTELPHLFNEAKEYMIKHWGFVKTDGIEAEDAVGITLNSEKHKDKEFIIVGQDHDLKQLEGIHFNPVKGDNGEWKTINKEDAKYFFNIQQIMGCSTDKVVGLKKGVGEKTAIKKLDGIPLEKQQLYILKLFIEEYGDYNGVLKFTENYRLLKILEEKEGFSFPEIQNLTELSKSGRLFSIEPTKDEDIIYNI